MMCGDSVNSEDCCGKNSHSEAPDLISIASPANSNTVGWYMIVSPMAMCSGMAASLLLRLGE